MNLSYQTEYVNSIEAFMTDESERKRVASDIWIFFRDGVETGIPDSLNIPTYGYDESVTRLAGLLSSAEGRQALKQEIASLNTSNIGAIFNSLQMQIESLEKEISALKKNSKEDPLDLFPDLKGSDNTVVLEGMKEELENYDTPSKPISLEEKEPEESFYTTSTLFTQSDFDDFEDLKKEVKGHKIILTIVTILIVLAIIFCILLVLNNFLGINFFKR